MERKGSGIKIYRDTRRGTAGRKERLTEMFFFSLAVSCLGAAWWNAVLSVFSLEADSRWLYGSLVIVSFGLTALICRAGWWTVLPAFLAAGLFLWRNWAAVEVLFDRNYGMDLSLPGVAAAVLTIPLLVLWIFVLRSGKGKAAAGAAAAAPFILAACAGFFPSFRASWFLLSAGVLYYVTGALGKMPVLKKTAALFMAAGSFAFLAGISVLAGRYLDIGRNVNGSFYQMTRETLRTDLVGRIERLAQRAADGERDTTDLQSGGDGTVREPQEEAAQTVGEEAQGAEIFGDAPAALEGSMDHLKEIESYAPDPEAYSSIVVVEERPAGTVYVPQRTGVTYTGDTWERGEDPGTVLGEEAGVTEEQLAYPLGLDRLEDLCRDWDKSSAEAVGRQIDEAFSAMAVYDVNPGSTPGEEDFAEYFLFENHKGFCVHFATTAALLYRMCGYPSIYIEGYAVPASAFVQMENGSYQARIDGTMGHAWCWVYEEGSGWENREHTPAAPESGAEETPETENRTESQTETGQGEAENRGAGTAVRTAILIIVLILLLAGAFLLQGALRRRKRRAEMAYTAEGNGVPAMYDAVLKTAENAGRARDRSAVRLRDDLGKDRLEELKADYPQLGSREWEWFHEQVMRSLFYYPGIGKEEWKRVCRLYRRFTDAARVQMGFGRRLIWRYIYCLDVFPRTKGKMGAEKEKQQKENEG